MASTIFEHTAHYAMNKALRNFYHTFSTASYTNPLNLLILCMPIFFLATVVIIVIAVVVVVVIFLKKAE